jgi:hypothetical protein
VSPLSKNKRAKNPKETRGPELTTEAERVD